MTCYNFREHHEQFRLHRVQLDRQLGGLRQRHVARQQSVRAFMVASAGVDHAVRAHDHGGHRWQPDRHMDRDDQQAHEERDELFLGQLVHS